MSLKNQIIDDMKSAMRSKEKLRLSVLRMIKSTIMNKEIETGSEILDDELLRLLNTLVKQRRDSADQYDKGGRPELAAAELEEIKIIETYLPKAATAEEISAAVDAAITETGAASMKEMGTVMKAVLEKLSGATVDGKIVSESVRSRLQ
jgi:uncharacterized protein YqeY